MPESTEGISEGQTSIPFLSQKPPPFHHPQALTLVDSEKRGVFYIPLNLKTLLRVRHSLHGIHAHLALVAAQTLKAHNAIGQRI